MYIYTAYRDVRDRPVPSRDIALFIVRGIPEVKVRSGYYPLHIPYIPVCNVHVVGSRATIYELGVGVNHVAAVASTSVVRMDYGCPR